jgi:DNA helicase-2/ATP-dependent DNA helicase PcrA
VDDLNLDNKHYKAKTVQARISIAKNSLMTPSAYANDEDVQTRDKAQRLPHIKEVYRIYTKRCKDAGAMDFDDLLLYTNVLFRDHPKVLAKYQDMFRFILVDEYQDTNYAQFLIVQQLAKAHGRVSVVGDDAQSIYSFRGARLDNMLQFPKIFDKAQVFKLEQNYRSTQNIVKAANSLIAKNKGQFDKNTFSENAEGSPIVVSNYYSDQEEGFSVARSISDLIQRGDTYQDCAILYRTNSQSRNFEEALRKLSIPYKIYGGLSFYQRKEIKDLIAYFRLSSNERDNEALKRIANFPTRGLGQVTMRRVETASNVNDVAMLDVCKNPLEYKAGVNAGTAKKLLAFANLIEGFQAQVSEKSAHEMAEIILNKSGILKEFSDQSDIENLSRKDNIQEILNALTIFEQERKKEDEMEIVTLLNFLEEVSLLTDQDGDKDEDPNKITLMTVHASKGLEFKNVFVVGMEKELFPSLQSMDSPRQYEEERRLFYVAITRAETNCFLSYAKSRYQWGIATICTPSPFLRDIDNKYLRAPGDVSFKTKRTVQREKAGASSDAVKIAALRMQQARKTNTVTPDFTPSNPSDISTGMTVEHGRFGRGKIINMEGKGEGAKATIFFQKEGQKNLLLKFAKLKIVK